MAVMHYGKKQKRDIFWKDMDNCNWLHKAFNCKGDTTGKGMLAASHFNGNGHKKRKKYHQFTRFSKTLLCYVQSIFASIENKTKPIADLAKLVGNSEEMAHLTATKLKCWD